MDPDRYNSQHPSDKNPLSTDDDGSDDELRTGKGESKDGKTWRIQNFCHKWLKEPWAKGWLAKVSDQFRAKCIRCNKMLTAKKSDLLKHARGKLHQRYMEIDDEDSAGSSSIIDNDKPDESSNSDGTSSDDDGSEDEAPPLTSKTKLNRGTWRMQHFCKKWLSESWAKGWLAEVAENKYRAKCVLCDKQLTAGKSELVRHTKCQQHIRELSERNSLPVSTEINQESVDRISKDDDVSRGEFDYRCKMNRHTWRMQPFCKKWLDERWASGWLAEVEHDKFRAKCVLCDQVLAAKKSALMRHRRRQMHKRKMNEVDGKQDSPLRMDDHDVDSQDETQNVNNGLRGANWRMQHFCKKWLSERWAKGWLAEVPNDKFHAKCIPCDKLLRTGKSELTRHTKRLQHQLQTGQIDEDEYEAARRYRRRTLDDENHDYNNESFNDTEIDEKFKIIFLKYIIANQLFSSCYVDSLCEEYCTLLTIEVNEVSDSSTENDWSFKMKNWIQSIKQSDYHSMSQTDKMLYGMIIQDKDPQLSVIFELQHVIDQLDLVNVGEDDDMWATLCSNIEVKSGTEKPVRCWEKILTQEFTRVLNKKQLLNGIQKHQIPIVDHSVLLNTTEQRLFDFIKWASENDRHKLLEHILGKKRDQLICRVCFKEDSQNATLKNMMVNIREFDEMRRVTFVEKLNKCMTTNESIRLNDGFPQYICKFCQYLLDKCYQFQVMCEANSKKLSSYYTMPSNVYDSKLISDIISDCYMIDENFESIDKSVNVIKKVGTVDGLKDLVEFCNINEESDVDQKIAIIDDNVTIEEINLVEGFVDDEFRMSEDGVEEDYKIRKVNVILPRSLQCKICGMKCGNFRVLAAHERKHSEPTVSFPCELCDESFEHSTKLKAHMLQHTDDRPFICEVCGKSVEIYSALKEHMETHFSDKSYKCTHCPYETLKNSCMKKHMLNHTRGNPHQCTECDRQFRTNSQMQKHKRNIHLQEKSHQCTLCDKKFFKKDSVRRHLVTHTGAKPFICPICTNPYGWYNGLEKHIKQMHPDIKVPPEKSFLTPDIVNTNNSVLVTDEITLESVT